MGDEGENRMAAIEAIQKAVLVSFEPTHTRS